VVSFVRNDSGTAAPSESRAAPPRSSISPTILLRDGKPYLVIGSRGGATIITTVLQTLVNRLDLGMTLPDAIRRAEGLAAQNAANTEAEPAFLDSPDRAALERLGQHFVLAPKAFTRTRRSARWRRWSSSTTAASRPPPNRSAEVAIRHGRHAAVDPRRPAPKPGCGRAPSVAPSGHDQRDRVRIGWSACPATCGARSRPSSADRRRRGVPGGRVLTGSADRSVPRRAAGVRQGDQRGREPAQSELHRQEARVAAALPRPPPTPTLLGSYDDGEWVALVYEDIEGRHPVTPWLPDEPRRVQARSPSWPRC